MLYRLTGIAIASRIKNLADVFLLLSSCLPVYPVQCLYSNYFPFSNCKWNRLWNNLCKIQNKDESLWRGRIYLKSRNKASKKFLKLLCLLIAVFESSRILPNICIPTMPYIKNSIRISRQTYGRAWSKKVKFLIKILRTLMFFFCQNMTPNGFTLWKIYVTLNKWCR